MKKVSIITATYNLIKEGREKHFVEMFESVHQQTYADIEHVIIDGNSQDGSVELIKKLINSKARHEVKFITEPDTGIYNAMNKGIRQSTGEYIIIMNSDDCYYINHAIKLLVDGLESKGADFSCGSCQIVKGECETKEIIPNPDAFCFQMPFSHNTMLVKRELFVEFGYFDEKYKLAADYDFVFKVCLNGAKHKVITDIVTIFRDGGATSKSRDLSKKETLQILSDYYEVDHPSKLVERIYYKQIGLLDFIKIQKKCQNLRVKQRLYHSLDFKYWRSYFMQKMKFRSIVKPFELLLKSLKNRVKRAS